MVELIQRTGRKGFIRLGVEDRVALTVVVIVAGVRERRAVEVATRRGVKDSRAVETGVVAWKLGFLSSIFGWVCVSHCVS